MFTNLAIGGGEHPPQDAERLKFARWLVQQRGLSVIKIDHPDATGQTDPKRIGKVPCAPWKAFQSAKPTHDNLDAWFRNGTPRNIGIVTGAISDLVVIDCDSAEAIAWADVHLPETPMRTRTVRGEHRFYRHPGVPIRNRVRLRTDGAELAIDVRGDGGYVVAPTSKHVSGALYEQLGSWPPVDTLPMFDPAWIAADEPAATVQPAIPGPSQAASAGPTIDEREHRFYRARAYVASLPPAIEGQGGDTHTFRLACKLVRGFGLSDADALDVLLPWNATCAPPWSERELEEKIRNAREYGDEPIGGLALAPPPTSKTATTEPRPLRGRAVTMEALEPWPDVVDGAMLLNGIVTMLRRYVILPVGGAVALALWLVHTYTMDVWSISPMFAATSPERRCGKSTLLILAHALSCRGRIFSNSSAASVFRFIATCDPTLLLDEVETYLSDQTNEFRGILDGGHTRATANVLRCVGDQHEAREFSTWCAKFLALIGKLPNTLADRSIEVGMRRKTKGETVERLRADRIFNDCRDVRRRCARWADDHRAHLGSDEPAVPAALHDRAADNWRPLLAIAEAAGGDWPASARVTALALTAASEENADDGLGIVLLNDVRTLFDRDASDKAAADKGFDRDMAKLSSAHLTAALNQMEDRPWSEVNRGRPLTMNKLARLLKPYQIEPRDDRFNSTDDKTARGYRRTDFKDAWARYCPGEPLQSDNADE